MILPTTGFAEAVETMSTEALRREFLAGGLFVPGEVRYRWWEVDRTVLGGIVPTDRPLELFNPDALRSDTFLERREVGVINVGGPGSIRADGVEYSMGNLDGLYLGRGVKSVMLTSRSIENPAKFWLLSYPAHVSYVTRHILHATAVGDRLGARETANERTLYKYFHPGSLQTCQLVMGLTRLEPGNVWNSMPPHTHMRRSEVYLYFNLQPGHVVFHFMGQPRTTRNLVVRDLEAVLSPPWSIHCGAGTSHYSFIWGMGGENQVFADMDPAPLAELR